MAAIEQDIEHTHGECSRTNGRVANLYHRQGFVDQSGILLVLQNWLHHSLLNQCINSGMQLLWRVAFQILGNTLLAHVLHYLLWRIECTFVFVVLQ